MILKVTDNQ